MKSKIYLIVAVFFAAAFTANAQKIAGTYNGEMIVEVLVPEPGEISIPGQDIIITNEGGTYSLSVLNFSFGDIQLGNLNVTGISATEEGGVVTLSKDGMSAGPEIEDLGGLATLIAFNSASINAGILTLDLSVYLDAPEIPLEAAQVANVNFEGKFMKKSDLPFAYGEQLWISTFDGDWETTNNEPVNITDGGGWHSFNTASTTIATTSAKSSAQFGSSTNVRPGAVEGSKSSRISSRSIAGIAVANGNMTTGRINAGSITAGNLASNYNRTVRADEAYNTPFESKPDSVTVWVNFKPKNDAQLGRISIFIHGNGVDFQDPPATAASQNAVVAFAGLEFGKTDDEWVRLTIPFNYESYTTFSSFNSVGAATTTKQYDIPGNVEPKYIVATMATNRIPGGTAGDTLWVDDFLMIYNPTLTTTIAGAAKSYHAGTEMQVSCTITGTMSPYNLNEDANVVRFELSDINGSFEYATILKEVTTDKSGEFPIGLPEDLEAGTYKFRVVTTNYPMISEEITIMVQPAVYSVTVNSEATNATGTASYEKGETVTIFAGTAPAGKRFKEWTVTSQNTVLADATSATTTFAMPPQPVTVTAVFEAIPTYPVTITSEATDATGAGNYKAGETVTIFAGAAPTGMQFEGWIVAPQSVVLTDASKATTTFTMPAQAVTLTAVFEPITAVETITGNAQFVYPNPVSTTLYITGIEVERAAIYTAQGVKIAEEQVHSGAINVASYKNGVYVIVVETKDGTMFRQVFVKK